MAGKGKGPGPPTPTALAVGSCITVFTLTSLHKLTENCHVTKGDLCRSKTPDRKHQIDAAVFELYFRVFFSAETGFFSVTPSEARLVSVSKNCLAATLQSAFKLKKTPCFI